MQRDVIVSLGGHSLREARRAAHRFLTRTSSSPTLESAKPRRAKIHPKALQLERERMRVKVKATKAMRKVLLDELEHFRALVLDRSGLREAGLGNLAARVDHAFALADPDRIARALTTIQRDVYTQGMKSASVEVGISWDQPPQKALDALYQHTITLSRNVVARELVGAKDALMQGVANGESIDEISDRIRDAFDDGIHIVDENGEITRVIPDDSWAEMVARTEVSRAMNAGIIDVYNTAGVEAIMWIASEDERSCDDCDENDGETVRMGDEFPDGSTEPPGHPSCAPAGTLILSARGIVPIEAISVGDAVLTHRNRFKMVTALSRRDVSEDIFELRVGSNVLRVTGNHPIYTGNGWAPAASLKPGDNIASVNAKAVCGLAFEPYEIPSIGREQCFLRAVGSDLSLGPIVPVSAVDFNGELAIGKRDVEQERPEREVWRSAESGAKQCVENDSLVCRVNDSLHRGKSLRYLGARALDAAYSIMRSLRKAQTFLRRRLLHTHEHCFAAVSLSESEPIESSEYRSASDTVLGGESLNRGSFDVLLVDAATPFVRQSSTCHIAIVPLDSVTVAHFDGVVYNFAVADDESYIADGIVVHNCRCTVVAADYLDDEGNASDDADNSDDGDSGSDESSDVTDEDTA